MFTANIKLPLWLPFVAVAISALFAFYEFGALSIIIFIGSLYLLSYFVAGMIRSKEAILIDKKVMKVKSPFRYHEWQISNIKKIYLVDNNSMLKGVIIEDGNERTVTLCSGIYDVNLIVVADYLVNNFPHLKVQKEEPIREE